MAHLVKDGEVFKINKSGFWWDQCCDCSLVHLNQIFQVGKDTFYRSYRDQWATEQARRRRKANKRKAGK